MGRKFEVTGKAVIYTHDGVKVVGAFKFFTGKDFPMTDLEPLVVKILDTHIITGDSLKIMNGWLNPQQSLF